MKILKIIIITFFITMIFSQKIFAIGDILTTGEQWTSDGLKNVNTTMDTTELKTASKDLYNLFLIVATAVVVIVGAILGIQFMTSGISKKAEAKEAFLPYVISCIVVFGSFGIWKLIVTILKDI